MSERHGLKYIWRTVPRAPSLLFESIRDVHPAMVQVMYTRGLAEPELCEDFLAGVCRDPDDPELLQDVPRAVERLVRAREQREQVAVFTDYDADGVNSAAVLATGLRMVGIEPSVRLPNRFVDGYGLTPAIVEELAGGGAHVVVTADCGSTSHEAAELARTLGVDLIITGGLTAATRATTCAGRALRSSSSRRSPTRCSPMAAPRWNRCLTWSRLPPWPTSCRCWVRTAAW